MKPARFESLYRADSVATSLGVSAAASVGSRLIGLVRGVALAWLIPQAQFGLFGIALLVVNVLLPVCSAGLYEGVTRYAPFHESTGTLRRFVVRSGVLVVAIALVATAILALFSEPLASAVFSASPVGGGEAASAANATSLSALARMCLVCVLALVAYQTLLGLLKGLRMFRAVGVAELTTACLFTLGALIGACSGFTTARALIGVYALACTLAVAVFAPGLIARIPPAESSLGAGLGTGPRRPSSNLLPYSLWAAGTAVLWHALSYYPMWYLLKVSNGQTVGTFHAVRLVTQFIHVGAVMLTAVVAANGTRVWEHEGREAAVPRLTVLTKASLLTLIGAAALLAALRPVALRVFPSTFASGQSAYDPLVLFFLLVGVVGLVAVRLNLVEKPRLVCLAWLAGAIVNVLASYVLLHPTGGSEVVSEPAALQSAAWAGVAGATAALAACLALAWREGLALDQASMLLIGAAYVLGAGWTLALPVAILLIASAFATHFIFSPADRKSMSVSLFRTTD